MNYSLGSHRLFKLWCLLLQIAACTVKATDGELPDLLDATLEELRQGLTDGSFSSVDLTKAYIARINEVNEQLHAVNVINPDALTIAAEMDQARADGATGMLHGIPVLIKDNIATNDQMGNTAGSFALEGATVSEDSTIAAMLRRAGAIILGKANMSQWSGFRSGYITPGWSSVGGQTVGAYFSEQDPSGSSSGSAVACSIGLAWACLGTETSSSLISPAENNNIVGIKPSVGLTSRHLVVPISRRQDSVGPMARTVKDAAHLLNAIVGKDDNDDYTSAIPFEEHPDYVAACNEDGLDGKRIGVPTSLIQQMNLPPAITDAFSTTLETLRSSGATVVEDIEFPGAEEASAANLNVVLVDFKTDLSDYFKKLATNPNSIESLTQLREFTQTDERENSFDLPTDMWDGALSLEFEKDSPEYQDFYDLKMLHGNTGGLNGALQNNTLDALIAPSHAAASLASYMGNPVISVPIGRMPDDTEVERNDEDTLNALAPNKPFGVAFTGALFSEEALIGMAYALEQKTKVRQSISPVVVPQIKLKEVTDEVTEGE